MWKTSLLCCVFVAEICSLNSEYEGAPCRNGDEEGVCLSVPDCPTARRALKHRHFHNLERCGFDHFTEIVCCPTGKSPPVPSTTPGGAKIWSDEPVIVTNPEIRSPINHKRKSVQVCEEYSNEVKPLISYHIVDGEDAELGEFPHMAALGYKSEEAPIKFECGGSLITNRYVLTAAHCVINIQQNPPFMVRLGVIDVTNSTGNKIQPLDYNIANITVHPNYQFKNKINDIALLKLKRKVTMTDYIYPACLYARSDDPNGLVATGWGSKEAGGESSNILQKAKLSPVSLEECNITYLTRVKRNLINTQICAADKKSDACQGDSGGPLQVQNETTSSIYSIVGITSYGIGCGGIYPGVYTRVYSYLDWIENIVWP